MNQRFVVLSIICLFYIDIGIFGSPARRNRGGVTFCGYEGRSNSDVNEYKKLGYKQNNQKHLTYKISKYSEKLSHADTTNIISKAFDTWSDVAELTFTRKLKTFSGRVDIEISFVRGEHGDGSAFVDRGIVLAHATQNYIHFDDSQDWSTDRRHEANLYSVAVHEIGHTLGLGHSNVKNAIMYEYHDSSNPTMELHADDIQGIQDMYGRKSTEVSTSDEDEPNHFPAFPEFPTFPNFPRFKFE